MEGHEYSLSLYLLCLEKLGSRFLWSHTVIEIHDLISIWSQLISWSNLIWIDKKWRFNRYKLILFIFVFWKILFSISIGVPSVTCFLIFQDFSDVNRANVCLMRGNVTDRKIVPTATILTNRILVVSEISFRWIAILSWWFFAKFTLKVILNCFEDILEHFEKMTSEYFEKKCFKTCCTALWINHGGIFEKCYGNFSQPISRE